MTLPDSRERPLLSVEEAHAALGKPISLRSFYEAVRAGDVPSIPFGRRKLIPTAALEEMVGLGDKSRQHAVSNGIEDDDSSDASVIELDSLRRTSGPDPGSDDGLGGWSSP